MKKTFACCIKSHCEMPDFETEFEAESREQAIDILERGALRDFPRDIIDKNLVEVNNGK